MRHPVGKCALPAFALGFLAILASPNAFSEEIPVVSDNALNQSVYSEGSTAIPGLIWSGENNQPDFTIEALRNGKPAARVQGKFESKNAGTLIFVSEVIQRAQYKDESGNFTVLIPLSSRKTPVKVQYIDDYGRKKAQDIEIVYENFYQFQLNQATKKRWNFDGGASFSYLDYSQKNQVTGASVGITQLGLTPKFGVTYNLSSKLDLGASAFGTLIGLPMKKSPEDLTTPRFYGINMRIGYKVYGLKTGNIYLMTGPYFWGMLVPAPSNYGVVKLSGPQLFLVGRFLTGSGRTAVGYMKFASILDGVGGMGANREVAVGAAYQITPAKHKRKFMVNLDFAAASFQIEGKDANGAATGEIEKIGLNSISLGISTPL